MVNIDGSDLVLKSGEGLHALESLPGVGKKTALKYAEQYRTWAGFTKGTKKYQNQLPVLATEISWHDPQFPQSIASQDPQVLPATRIHAWGTQVWNLFPASRLVAVIGGRYPKSPDARHKVEEAAASIATWAVEQQCVVVSGLAEGADQAAHKACLDSGGRTIAVAPKPLDGLGKLKELADRIVREDGCLVSLLGWGNMGNPNAAPLDRNPVIVGLAETVVVAGAEDKGGTLKAVGHALRQKRKLLVFDHGERPEFAGGQKLLAEKLPEETWLTRSLGLKPKEIESLGLRAPLAMAWSPDLDVESLLSGDAAE